MVLAWGNYARVAVRGETVAKVGIVAKPKNTQETSARSTPISPAKYALTLDSSGD